MSYPDRFLIAGVEYEGVRRRGEVSITYSDAPIVKIGDFVMQRNGPNWHSLEVLDVNYIENGSMGIGTEHSHLLRLNVQNVAAQFLQPKPVQSINIVSAQQVQIGDNNSQMVTVTLSDVVRSVAAGDDAEAKSLLKRLLENNTVAAVVGAGVSALLGLL